jgi:hypothetical protein
MRRHHLSTCIAPRRAQRLRQRPGGVRTASERCRHDDDWQVSACLPHTVVGVVRESQEAHVPATRAEQVHELDLGLESRAHLVTRRLLRDVQSCRTQ